MRRPRPSKPRPASEFRIIAGRWRGRKLAFDAGDSIRPTPERVRETLFNWLQFDIQGMRCLDLFAGSGALGLEALSRGAAQVVWVEQQQTNARYIRDHLAALNAEAGSEVVADEAATWLAQASPTPFDLVLLDPPFGQGWLSQIVPLLEARPWLAATAMIYAEFEPGAAPLPEHWLTLKQKQAGQVCYGLFQRA